MSNQQINVLTHHVRKGSKYTKDIYIFHERSDAVEKASSLLAKALSNENVEQQQISKHTHALKSAMRYGSTHTYTNASHQQCFDIQKISCGDRIRCATVN